MYQRFYNLNELPFSNELDLRFQYLSESYQECLSRLIYGLHQGKGFVLLTGNSGSGKTYLIHIFLKKLVDVKHVALVSGQNLSAFELLRAICRNLNLSGSGTKEELILRLNQFLVCRREDNEKVLIIIDDAHHLKSEVLEEIRLLSNFETGSHKLISIFLVGRNQLRDTLNLTSLRQLKQRISVDARVDGFSLVHTRNYIRQRLDVVAFGDSELFSESAVRKLYELSGGVPGMINRMCDMAMMLGYFQNQKVIPEQIVKQVKLLLAHQEQDEPEFEIDAGEIHLPMNENKSVNRSYARWTAGILALIFSILFVLELIL